MKEISPIQFYTPKQVSDLLHINPSTLRKYCALVTKYHGKEYFKRDATNARIFSRYDVDMLERIAELKKAPNVTLDNAVMIALSQLDSSNAETPATPTDTSDKAAFYADIATVQSILLHKDKQIQQLMDLNHQLLQSNEQLSNDIRLLMDKLDQQRVPAPNDKLPFLKKLFSKSPPYTK